MRPHMEISHALSGRVKDLANAREITTSEAWELVIRTGLDELEEEGN